MARYYRSGGFLSSIPPVTRALLFLIGGLFLLSLFLGNFMAEWLMLRPGAVVFDYRVWQLVTYAFLHFSLGHLFFNALALFFFGPMVENFIGGRRYLALVLMTALIGGIVHTLLYWAVAAAQGSAVIMNIGVVGISGVVTAILVACLFIAPNAQVFLYFIPMRLKTMVMIILGLEVLFVLSNGIFSPVSHVGHLVGALVGFLAFRFPRLLNFSEGKPVLPGRRVKSRPIAMGHPGRSARADSRYDDPHWRLDQ